MASKCLTKNNLSVLDWGGESSDSNELCTIGYAISHFNAERRSGSYQDTSLYPDNRIVTGHMEGGPHNVPNEIKEASTIAKYYHILDEVNDVNIGSSYSQTLINNNIHTDFKQLAGSDNTYSYIFVEITTRNGIIESIDTKTSNITFVFYNTVTHQDDQDGEIGAPQMITLSSNNGVANILVPSMTSGVTGINDYQLKATYSMYSDSSPNFTISQDQITSSEKVADHYEIIGWNSNQSSDGIGGNWTASYNIFKKGDKIKDTYESSAVRYRIANLSEISRGISGSGTWSSLFDDYSINLTNGSISSKVDGTSGYLYIGIRGSGSSYNTDIIKDIDII